MDTLSDKLLILDLDETLIHATPKALSREADFAFEDYHVYMRPGVEQFLREVAAHYRLGVWSSADDEYVRYIVNALKPDGVQFEVVWGRSRCTMRRHFYEDIYGEYDLAYHGDYYWEKRLKKLKALGYPLEKILLIDDSPEKARHNYGNAIYIKEFNGDLEDRELEHLSRYLLTLRDADNVRAIEKRGWRETITGAM